MGRLPGQVESVSASSYFAMTAMPLWLKNRCCVAAMPRIVSLYFSFSRLRGTATVGFARLSGALTER